LSKVESDESFEGATLFVKGGHSKYISKENFEKTQKKFPHSELITVEKVGHWVHAEAPKELLNIFNDFLA